MTEEFTISRAKPQKTWYYHMMINVVLGYTGIYVAGYYIRAYPLKKPVRLVIYSLGILSAGFTIWGTRYHSLRTGMMKEYVFEYLSPNVVLFSVAVFVLFRYLPLDRMSPKLCRAFSQISRLSFGLYLCHDIFIMLRYRPKESRETRLNRRTSFAFIRSRGR